ncbi:baseplate hub protein [Yersinia sp. 2545 StPb PI]|uniref:baseplate hub protein n=1 Tax=Yersinia sp. 2545 StPb PI TaxID=3117410 RepID=UPI003FA436F2
MSYQKRKITVNFTLSEDDFGDGNDSLTISGLRVEAQIDNAGGVSGSTLYAKIYGMKESDMNKCCTYAQVYGVIKNIAVTMTAGDEASGMSQVFQGTIFNGLIDYNEAPNVPLVIQAKSGFVEQILPAASNSSQGSTNVASMIESIAKSIDFGFTNNGVNTSLSNHYSWGSPVEQIRDIARAAGIDLSIENRIVSIWPTGGVKDNQMVHLSPSEGLVGYPTYLGYGYSITAIFTPDIVRGRRLRLLSASPRANGDLYIQAVSHLISSEIPGGPWFTMSTLTSTSSGGEF